MKTRIALAVAAAMVSVACAGGIQDTVASERGAAPAQPSPISAHTPASETRITLEQAMADPRWLGRAPQGAYWNHDGSAVIYERQQAETQLYDTWVRALDGEGNGEIVPLDSVHLHAYRDAVYNDDYSLSAWVFEQNIFVQHQQSGEVRQLTRDRAQKSELQFMTDGRLSFRSGQDFYALDPSSGRVEMLAQLATNDEPEAVQEPRDYLAREELELIEYNQVQREERQDQFDQRQALQQQSPAVAPEPFYLGEGRELVGTSLSPAGDYLVVAVSEPQSWRGDSDVMPRYVTESGRIVNQDVRRRVADAEPVNHDLYLLDLTDGTKVALSYETLPGYDEDVLRDVREENYAARGETYESERSPRPITLMNSWSAAQGNINWSDDGAEVAVMLKAWDNKDRWIARVDTEAGELVNEHRLHDYAWINRTFNDFGFLPGGEELWYLSEEDGYSHLYVRNLDTGQVQQLTDGHYIVDEVTLNRAGDTFYFHANKPHPGVYEVYRVSAAGGDIEQLTDLGGINRYELSPAEDQLLVTHSSVQQPPELYLQPLDEAGEARRLTHTISDEFLAMPWADPEIVPVPSSHVDEPIYSRVYKPADFDPDRAEAYPAVVFIHGAGYLQNAHAGWSNYFREYMFHNKLVQQGYVVLDLDFRGSKGYGRDWRTAVYRQMGTPEVEDLVDVVDWMTEHANVDPERVGTYGGSYGGFLTFMALFNEPGLFQAGAALRPVTDWAHYNTGYTSNILNLPEDDPIAYRRSSPIYFAEGLEDALLISAPMVDDNVFFQDSVRLVQRLIELEKENFETAIFPVEPHGFVQPSSWLDQYRRIYKLYEDNLKD